jgi:hypothetical protein
VYPDIGTHDIGIGCPNILPDIVPDIMTFHRSVLLFPAAAAAAAAVLQCCCYCLFDAKKSMLLRQRIELYSIIIEYSSMRSTVGPVERGPARSTPERARRHHVHGGCGSAELAGSALAGEGTATLSSITLCAVYLAIFPCQ